jgi:hypothetical protein
VSERGGGGGGGGRDQEGEKRVREVGFIQNVCHSHAHPHPHARTEGVGLHEEWEC